MESVLTDLELDLREIRYLMDILSREPDSMLRMVAVRRVRQMQSHLDVLLQEIEEVDIDETKDIITGEEETEQPLLQVEQVPEAVLDMPSVAEQSAPVAVEITEIRATQVKSWGDRLKPAVDLKSSFSLNDRFLFSRELFDGDMEHMDKILLQISQMESVENVLSLLDSVIEVDKENEIYQDFVERTRKYFE